MLKERHNYSSYDILSLDFPVNNYFQNEKKPSSACTHTHTHIGESIFILLCLIIAVTTTLIWLTLSLKIRHDDAFHKWELISAPI